MSEQDNFDLDKLSPEEFVNEKLAGKSDTEVSIELAKLELEMKKLELIAKKQQLEDMELDREYKKYDIVLKRQARADLEGKQTAKLEENAQKMESLLSFMRNRAAQQAHCNHRKGGVDASALIRGEGTSDKFCIVKHGLPNGNFFVICTRCNKEWHPARPYNVEGGKLRPLPATDGWYEMINNPTDNTASASARFEIIKN